MTHQHYFTLILAAALAPSLFALGNPCAKGQPFQGKVTQSHSDWCRGSWGVTRGDRGFLASGLPAGLQVEGLEVQGCGVPVPRESRPCFVNHQAWEEVRVYDVTPVDHSRMSP